MGSLARVWTQRKISLGIKLRIYQTYILPNRSIRIGNVDHAVNEHEKAAGVPQAMPTSNLGHQVAGRGTQHHSD